MPDPTDPWHPYRSTVEDHLGSCTDYLGRLRRSLAGEIAPDRHYFADKAHQLHAATRRIAHHDAHRARRIVLRLRRSGRYGAQGHQAGGGA